MKEVAGHVCVVNAIKKKSTFDKNEGRNEIAVSFFFLLLRLHGLSLPVYLVKGKEQYLCTMLTLCACIYFYIHA